MVIYSPHSSATGASRNSGDGARHRTDILHAALTYAKRGWAVLPLWWPLPDGRCACGKADCDSVGKHPIGKPGMAPNGVNSATDESRHDPDMVAVLSACQCRHRHRQAVGSLGSRRRRAGGCRNSDRSGTPLWNAAHQHHGADRRWRSASGLQLPRREYQEPR